MAVTPIKYPPHIAIVGGGFCGAMTLINLVQQMSAPLTITLIEKSSTLAKGTAYGTTEPCHLLNVPACKMGALHEKPDHFYQWLLAHEKEWRNLHSSFKNLLITPESYLPRMVYGLYLEILLEENLLLAQQKKIIVSILRKEATHIEEHENSLDLAFSEGSTLKVDAIILALGVPQNKNFHSSSEPLPNYIANIWSAPSESFLKSSSLRDLSENTQIVMIGSGLTMLDAYASLMSRGYPGKVVVISGLGKLPEMHIKHFTPYPHFIDLQNPPSTAIDLLRVVKRELNLAIQQGINWRGVVDELRVVIGQIWEQFSWKEKRRAIRHLLNNWNHYRHRMPWNYAEDLKKQKFILMRGKVTGVYSTGLEFRSPGNKEDKFLEANYIVNCSGPDMNIYNQNSKFIKNLIKDGWIIPDPLNAGIQANRDGIVKGKGGGRLFALGHILFGERLETTAVPDLRRQCFNLAKFISSKSNLIN